MRANPAKVLGIYGEQFAKFNFILKIGKHGDTAREHFEVRFCSCNCYRHIIMII